MVYKPHYVIIVAVIDLLNIYYIYLWFKISIILGFRRVLKRPFPLPVLANVFQIFRSKLKPLKIDLIPVNYGFRCIFDTITAFFF